ncbi:hypothetical protein Peur_030161 [Populus x canadensis]
MQGALYRANVAGHNVYPSGRVISRVSNCSRKGQPKSLDEAISQADMKYSSQCHKHTSTPKPSHPTILVSLTYIHTTPYNETRPNNPTCEHYTKLILHRKNLSSQSLKEGMLGEMRSYDVGVMKLIVRIIREEEYDVGEELLDTYITLNAITGANGYQTMRVNGKAKEKPLSSSVARTRAICNSETEEHHKSAQSPLQHLLTECGDVFTEPKSLPSHRSHDHQIVLKESTYPINLWLYRYSNIQRVFIEEMEKELLSSGIIQHSTSPFSSPVVLVKQKRIICRLYFLRWI